MSMLKTLTDSSKLTNDVKILHPATYDEPWWHDKPLQLRSRDLPY